MVDKNAQMTGKAATINRIIRAARHEFSESGVAGARMDNIAAGAGVSKQLLYHYFTSKKSLFAAVLNERTDRVLSGLLGIDLDTNTPETALRNFLKLMFDQYRNDPDLTNIAQEAIAFHNEPQTEETKFPDMAPALVAKIDPVLKNGIKIDVFRENIDTRYFLAMASLIISGGFTNSYMLSSILGFDTNSEDGLLLWRDYSVNFVIAAILKDPERNP
ncbi:MAG: TetR/AcrR family transcriptional regulator [Hyphomonadaceae bacterium]|nr:TetR/AcrR family transcriptional regulator [Hyphomonadaceae bacterium]